MSPICSDRILPHTVFRRDVHHRLAQTRWYITATAHLCSRTSSQSLQGLSCSAVQCCTICTRRGSNRSSLSCCPFSQSTALGWDFCDSSSEIFGVLFQLDSLQVYSRASILLGAKLQAGLLQLHSKCLQPTMRTERLSEF